MKLKDELQGMEQRFSKLDINDLDTLLKQLKESDKKIHRSKKHQTKVQFGDKIYLSEGSFSLTIEYDQIINKYDLEHSYALMFGKKNGILLEPSSFARGTFEDFKDFIKEKTD